MTFTLTYEDMVVFSFCLFPESSYLFWALSFGNFLYMSGEPQIIYIDHLYSELGISKCKRCSLCVGLGAPLWDGQTEIGLFHWGNQNVSTFKPFPCGYFSVQKNRFLCLRHTHLAASNWEEVGEEIRVSSFQLTSIFPVLASLNPAL